MAGFDLDAARVVRMQQDLEALLPHDDEVLRQEILRLLTIGARQHANLIPLLRDALRSRQKRPTPATSAKIGTDHDDAGLEMEALPTVRRATLWPCRPKRFPGELLSSWLWRTAREQGRRPDVSRSM